MPLDGWHYVFPEVLPDPLPLYELRFLEYVLQEDQGQLLTAGSSQASRPTRP